MVDAFNSLRNVVDAFNSLKTKPEPPKDCGLFGCDVETFEKPEENGTLKFICNPPEVPCTDLEGGNVVSYLCQLSEFSTLIMRRFFNKFHFVLICRKTYLLH